MLQCSAIERAVLGLLVKCAQMCHGTGNGSSSGSRAAQPDPCSQQLKQSVKSHPRATSFAGQNTQKILVQCHCLAFRDAGMG